MLTMEAFRAAADPKRFPEQFEEGLRPWQALKLFAGARSSDDWAVELDPGSAIVIGAVAYERVLDGDFEEGLRASRAAFALAR